MEGRFGAVAPIVDKEESMNNWKYKIDISSLDVFDEIEKEYGITIPKEIREFIAAHNGATPEKYHFMIGTTEKVFGAVLSVNKGETDTDTIFTALRTIGSKELIPFAIDPFGNYICFSNAEESIVFWDHENDGKFKTGLSLKDFITSLY